MTWCKLLLCSSLALALTLASCGFYRITPRDTDPDQLKTQAPVQITTPTKAHLKDGGVVLFAHGFEVDGELLRGDGEKYDLTRQSRTLVKEVDLADVAALEHYEKELLVGTSIAASVPAIVLGGLGSLYLLKAIFGSCPTVYALEEERRLEAELFSHSISQRFEADDLDRLSDVRLRNGGYRLQVANEAPETHYINRLVLQTVDHPVGTRAFPSPGGDIVVFEGDTGFTARSRLGENLTKTLVARDGIPYRTVPALTRKLAQEITEDWLELTVPVSAESEGKPPVLVLRLRNTLMATVLLYEVMLKAQGVKALEWLGADTSNPLYAWRIFRWFRRHYSLRVQAWDGNRFVTAARVSPTGPIAWHDVAIELPPAAGPEVRIRLAFLPDNWMVDWVSVGFGTRHPLAIQSIPAARVDGVRGEQADDILAALRKKDSNYLVTSPGESYTLFFPSETPAPGTVQSGFIRSRGFYIEWLREDWFRGSAKVTESPTFEPGDEAVKQTARLWLRKKDDLERRFAETKIPLAGGAR